MRIGILAGGGPAPGMNGVISAATVAARARGWEVLGIPNGFSRLMKGEAAARPLAAEDVAGIETTGGCLLLTSRANPTKDPAATAKVVEAVRALRLDALVTIGGDDTATSAAKVAEAAGGLRVAHVPKTIDNDLPLPDGAPTFGFDTARQLGAQLCRNLRVDARTTGRWYLVSAMGRSAGHLALGMGVGSGADLVLVPEEFPESGVTLDAVANLVDAAIAKRRAQGQGWGLVVLGEGILDRLDRDDLARVARLEMDEHGNPRMSEVDLGAAVRDVLKARLAGRSLKVDFITKIIGYELRCADPTAFDVQYTRTLGAGAVRFLAEGKGSGLVAVRDGKVVAIPLADLRDPATGRVRVRRVDLASSAWMEAVALQARVSARDLEGEAGAGLAKAAAIPLDEARRRWGSAVAKAVW